MKYINDLEPLIDIIDFIEPTNEMNDNTDQLIESCYTLFDAYISENPTAISDPDFEEIIIEEITDMLIMQIGDNITDKEHEDLEEIVEYAYDQYFEFIATPRSYPDSIIINEQLNIDNIQKQLDYLSSKPQPTQRTPEWYTFRHNLITASNAYKAFENQTIKNQLIYEKCLPLLIKQNIDIDQPTIVHQVNINTTLHWGQKYEPLSVMLYEYIYKSKVADFGCIQHDMYSFIGASPDGINVDQTSKRFGRMLEIKNIVNREIDGIPKKEYWIQMQMQMETCNLEECDFLETKFEEYLSYDEFMLDGSFLLSLKNERKGIIMYFANADGNPKYVYLPLHIQTNEEFEIFESATIDEFENMTWISNYYWKLEIMSCVLVPRNKQWFQSNIQELTNIWNIILEERETDYSHRAPNKRANKLEIQHVELNQNNGCLLELNKETGKYSIINK